MAIAAAVLSLPAAAGAASGPALPPSRYGGGCAGDMPVVVASDIGAQSDIYSAVTLAGVLGTDCVVLAGPRGEAMPAAQQARLAAADAGGYIVGGAAAVPDCKLAGRSMARLAGADRWATAEAVGAEAKRIADGKPSTPRAIPDTACPARGYSAVSAGLYRSCAIRTDGTLTCWTARADDNGFATGGVVKVDAPAGKFKAVSAGGGPACAIRTDGKLACWDGGWDGFLSTLDAPAGKFKAVSASAGGRGHACAIRTDGKLACWGFDGNWWPSPPEGSFKAVAAGHFGSCAIRTNGTVTCWDGGWDGFLRTLDAPAGRFKAIAAGGGHSCAIRTNGTLTCWAPIADANTGQTDAPSGRFKAIAVGRWHACAIRTDGTVACWGANGPSDVFGDDLPPGIEPSDGRAQPPAGRYTAIAAGLNQSCAIRKDGTLTCWGAPDQGRTDAPYR